MLCRNLMPRSHDAALEQRERGFDAVRRDVSVNVDASLVLDGSVLLYRVPRHTERTRIRWQFIRHNDFHIAADILFDVLRQRSRFAVFRMKESKLSATLLDAEHDFLVISPSLNATASQLRSDVGLVALYDTCQRLLIDFLHRCADAMAEIPCRLVGYAHDSLDLVRAHALSGLAEEVRRKKPLHQREVGIVEDRPGCNAKIVVAGDAVPLFPIGNLRHLLVAAARAFHTLMPAQGFEVFPALGFIAELFDQRAKIHGVCHV